jgi:diadenosine tetraphosphate (Ap4A) HIT family hydrolase
METQNLRAEKSCPFCLVSTERMITKSGPAIAISDKFPVSNGHTLVIPTQHVCSIFDLSEIEFNHLWKCVRQVRHLLIKEWQPAGFNIGLNDGPAGGQTIAHAHVHVIPRYDGDLKDPRGGIRWILPKKAKYWDE